MSYWDRLQSIRRRVESATPGPWAAFRHVDEAGQPLRGQAIVEYVAGCVRAGGDGDFYGVSCEKPDGAADVCHTGNGPTSKANAEFLANARSDVEWMLERLEDFYSARTANKPSPEVTG